jgi:hypothetical protein
MTILQGKGDCLESLMPYITSDICTQPSDAALADATERKISGYSVVWGQQGAAPLDTIRGYLAAGTPVLVAAPVYQSFYANADGTIEVHADGERYYGGHALLLVGYDKDGFWALNSWGPTWGHDGFAYLSNEFVRREAWEGWIMDALLGAPTVLFVDVVDQAGAFVLGGSLILVRDGVEITTKANVGGTVQFDTRTPGRYCVKPLPPTGYASDTQVECLTTGDRLRFVWRKVPTPTPTWTLTPTRTAVPTWTATPTVKPLPTIHPTGEPTVDPTILPPTPDADAPRWALLSWWGSWGLVGEHQPGAINFLAVPREDWPMIRRQVYLAQGSPLPQYDTWGMSKLGYALYNAECGAVLTPPVVVIDDAGQDRYLAVGTRRGYW